MGEESVELLSRVPLFAELSPKELEQIASVAIPRSFPRGVRVFHEGDHSDACYIVRSGSFRVTLNQERTRVLRSWLHDDPCRHCQADPDAAHTGEILLHS